MFDYDEEDRPIMDSRWGTDEDWREHKRQSDEASGKKRRRQGPDYSIARSRKRPS